MEKFLHAFNLVPNIGHGILQKLWNYFGDFEEAWKQANLHLLQKLGCPKSFSSEFLTMRKRLQVDEEFEKLEQQNVVAFGQESQEFPVLLREIPNPPFLLYRRGMPLHRFQQCVAIVGTRMPSTYGEKVAFELAEQVTLQGGTVVSGLAFGIDAKAHAAAVKNHLPTVAVLASGVLNITPASHRYLAEEILKNGGTLVSEYVSEVPSMKYRYLDRNRLISGLCDSTIIIEAKIRSGALITANHALEQNRTIYALPGDITRPQAQGCLSLIADGARPIVSIDQTLIDLGFAPSAKKTPSFTPLEKFILEQLEKKPCSTEDLLGLTDMPLPRLNGMLSSMEMKGFIRRNHSMQWEAG